jgi:alanyl-tRNA synthetase
MGNQSITIDFDGVIPMEEIPDIEREANEAVWKNLPVSCTYPSEQALETIAYRSKKALPWPVRIVEVPGSDTCACCGTHVKFTGEIGVIKLISAMPFRGGTRMEMACGAQALHLLNACFDQNRLVSQAFSAKILETGEAAQRMNDQVAALKYRLTGLERQIFESIAANCAGKGDVVHFEENLDNVAVRELADKIADVCGGMAAVFSGSDADGYAFCMVAREGDLRQLCKDMTAALGGRGGGKSNFQQGRVSSSKAEIEAFFVK